MSAEQKHFLEYKQKGVELVNWLRLEMQYPEGITPENVYVFEREYHDRLSKIESSLMKSFHNGEISEKYFGEKCEQLDESDRDVTGVIKSVKESPSGTFGGIVFMFDGEGPFRFKDPRNKKR
jgi:hypothetical protein